MTPILFSNQALKAAIARLVRACGGQEAAAPDCRVSHQTLSDYANLSKPDSFMPVDVVASLESISDSHPQAPVVTRALARLAGYELVQLPDHPLTTRNVTAALGVLTREHGELSEKVGAALSDDGRVSKREVHALGLIGEIDDVILSAITLRHWLKSKLGADDA